jgi:hypothetical protein
MFRHAIPASPDPSFQMGRYATRIASQAIREAGEQARTLVREALLAFIAMAVVLLGLPFAAGYFVGRARRSQ